MFRHLAYKKIIESEAMGRDPSTSWSRGNRVNHQVTTTAESIDCGLMTIGVLIKILDRKDWNSSRIDSKKSLDKETCHLGRIKPSKRDLVLIVAIKLSSRKSIGFKI